MYLETLVNALKQILGILSLNVGPILILTPSNTSHLLVFKVDPINFIGMWLNGLSKKLNFLGLALKML